MRTYVILFRYDLIKDPVPESAVHIKVHTQLHSATGVLSQFRVQKEQWRNIGDLAKMAPLGSKKLPPSGAPGLRAY